LEPSRENRDQTKQNKHGAAKLKAMRTSQRTSEGSEVMNKMAPGLDEDSRCEKKSYSKRACFQIEQKREEMFGVTVMLT